MISTYIIGIAGMVGLMVAWVLIQDLWRNTFSDHMTDEDVLAGRSSCSNCGCTTFCQSKMK